jgi:hypothetical protein
MEFFIINYFLNFEKWKEQNLLSKISTSKNFENQIRMLQLVHKLQKSTLAKLLLIF